MTTEPPRTTVYIVATGLGTYVGENLLHADTENVYQLFDYGSPVENKWYKLPFIVYDFACLIKDIGAANENNPNKAANPNRLEALCDMIINYYNNGYKNIVLVGISHGSLIINAAILRLQIELDKHDIFDKIKFYTIGSPRYPNPWLLRKYEQILNTLDIKSHLNSYKLLNFYDQGDAMLYKNKGILKIFKGRNPFIKNTNGNKVSPNPSTTTNKENKPYTFNPNTRIIFNKFDLSKITPVATYGENLNHINTYMMYPLYVPNIDVSDYDKIKYDTRPLLGLFSADMEFCKTYGENKLYDITQYKDNSLKEVSVCPSSTKSGGGNKKSSRKIQISKTGKTFTVRTDKDTRKKYIVEGKDKTRVYLGDLKGKYKYVQ